MNLLSAAERISAMDRKAVVFKGDRCLHSIDKFVECDMCYDICPVDAIEPGKPPTLATDTCQTCLACLTVCPTGAFTAEDAVPALLKCAVRIDAEEIELGCEAHPRLETGLSTESLAVRLRGCLAGLGSGAYLAMAAADKHSVTIRLDACAECPWDALKSRVLEQVKEANNILNAMGIDENLRIITRTNDIELHNRPVWDADNPPMSRRDLFRFASQRSQVLAARALHPDSSMDVERRPSANRLRMAAAVDQLPDIRLETNTPVGFAMISVSDECTACGSCSRACPTNAIHHTQKDVDHFQLHFDAKRCIGCGICLQLCIPEAISIDREPSLTAVFGGGEPILLIEGEVTRCERCNMLMARKPGVTLCPVCEYRRANPFSGALPPHLMRLLKNRSSKELS